MKTIGEMTIEEFNREKHMYKSRTAFQAEILSEMDAYNTGCCRYIAEKIAADPSKTFTELKEEYEQAHPKFWT